MLGAGPVAQTIEAYQDVLYAYRRKLARVGFAIVVYLVYSILLSAAKVWLEKGELSPLIGVWWIHLAALGLGLYLVVREARTA